ncbi:MAG: hypothetical protein ACMXYK_04490 [Candidatus Woesearchaeota archaeon]
MTEKKLVVEGETVSYHGIFNAKELYNLIENFANERGWDRKDYKHEVLNRETHRDIIWDLRPNATISEYAKYEIHIKGSLTNVTDIEVVLDGKKTKMQKGNVKITFVGFLFTEYEKDWQSSAGWYVFRTIIEKFIMKTHMDDYEAMIQKHVSMLKHEVSAYLNLTKYVSAKTQD